MKDFTRDERRSISSLELILFHFVKESATREAERENQPGCKTSFARIQEKVEALTHSDKNLSMVANNRYWINYFIKWLLKNASSMLGHVEMTSVIVCVCCVTRLRRMIKGVLHPESQLVDDDGCL